MKLEGNALEEIYYTDYANPEWYVYGENEGFLGYYASNHLGYRPADSLNIAYSDGINNVYTTQHGVFVESALGYKCLFISDFGLTGGPEKLRWESISDLQIIGNYIVLKQSLFPAVAYNIFIINIASGRVGRIKHRAFDKDDGIDDALNIENGRIIIDNQNRNQSFNLKEIFKELDEYVFE